MKHSFRLRVTYFVAFAMNIPVAGVPGGTRTGPCLPQRHGGTEKAKSKATSERTEVAEAREFGGRNGDIGARESAMGSRGAGGSDTVLRMGKILLLALLPGLGLWAADEMTVYDLLAPGTHSFDIVYDVSTRTAGAAYFFNPIRAGSTASKERVVDRASGKPLTFTIVDGKTAKASGAMDASTPDDAQFLRVALARPVPKGAETRIRIYKTYTDAASYYATAAGLEFERPLGIKRNVVILPKGYELTGSASPAIVSTDPDGRVRLSFINDRDDQLPVRITARRLP